MRDAVVTFNTVGTLDAFVTLGDERETVQSAAQLLREMDRAGVERALIHPQDRAMVVDNDIGNAEMIETARMHGDRLIAVCTANPWYGERAVRSVLQALEQGARMVAFAPALQGFILGDEILFPLLEKIEPLRVPVYVHTGPHSHSSPWHLVNVAERYPDLPFIMGHSGATDYWNDVPDATLAAGNIYLESSFARPFTLAAHLRRVGLERGIMGSGAPRNLLGFEWEQMRAEFPADENRGLFGGTILSLLQGVQL